MKYFKIIYGYNDDDYLSIVGDELPKALVLFMEGKGKGVFNKGVVRGQDIMRIVPDWHKFFSWNNGYKLTPSEHKEISKHEQDYQNTFMVAKNIAQYVIANDKRELLQKTGTEILNNFPEFNIDKLNKLIK